MYKASTVKFSYMYIEVLWSSSFTPQYPLLVLFITNIRNNKEIRFIYVFIQKTAINAHWDIA